MVHAVLVEVADVYPDTSRGEIAASTHDDIYTCQTIPALDSRRGHTAADGRCVIRRPADPSHGSGGVPANRSNLPASCDVHSR